MIKLYKILSGKYDESVTPTVSKMWKSNIRENDLRLQKGRAKYDWQKVSFTYRVVDIGIVCLITVVVLCDTSNTSKARRQQRAVNSSQQ